MVEKLACPGTCEELELVRFAWQRTQVTDADYYGFLVSVAEPALAQPVTAMQLHSMTTG